MNANEKSNAVNSARGLAKWFSVDITIKIFGVTIWELHFPPKKDE